jgi:mRNA interferase MazF
VGLKRGDVVTVALQGDLGKPRPALIVESDRIAPTDFVLVCPGTSHLDEHALNRRFLVVPDATNGLRLPTQFQTDKLASVHRTKCRQVVGRLDDETMMEISTRLVVVLGLTE